MADYKIVVVLLVAVVSSLSGQSNIRFENHTLEDGLPHNNATCIIQDRSGWIWIGTDRGLCRFDAISFKTYLLGYQEPEIESSNINCLFEDAGSRLWIGTADAGLALYNRETDSFTYSYSSDTCNKCISSNTVLSLTADSSGILWIGTDNGLNKFDPQTSKFQRILYEKGSATTSSGNLVNELYFDSRHRLWIGTSEGLNYLNPETGEIIKVRLNHDTRRGISEVFDVYEIMEDHEGNLMVGTYNKGLIRIDPVSNRILSRILPDPDYPRSYAVRSIEEDQQGNYWLGTRGGVYILDQKWKIIAHYTHEVNDHNSLNHISVNKIMEDSFGSIWIATRNGISQMNPVNQMFTYYRPDETTKQHLNNPEVYAILEDEDGRIWLGTEAGGVNIFDKTTGRFSYLMYDEKNGNSISSNTIKSIIQDRHGNFWIGTYRAGLNYYNAGENRFTHYLHDPNDDNSLSDNRVWALLEDAGGDIWIGTSGGLDRFDPVNKRFYHYGDSLRSKVVQAIFKDSAGNLLVGHSRNGLSIITPDSGVIHRDLATRVIFEDSQERIWIGSDNYHGLHQFTVSKGVVNTYTIHDGLPSNQILGILEDNNQNLWLSTGLGLSLFNPALETFDNFSKEDGLQGNKFYYGSYCRSRSGELFFGGQNGLTSFFPERLVKNNNTPPVYTTGFRIFNEEIPVGKEIMGKVILEKSITESEEIVLNYNHSSFTLDFVALNYVNSAKNEYACFLEGFEKNWNYIGSNRSATYTNLDPGKYTFRVKASNNDGIWNEEGASLSIIVTPPIWMTEWFKFSIILLIIGIIYLIISFLVKRNMLRNQLVLERIRSKELHKIDMLKFQFFTNISHEIRTPISLIVSPLTRIRNSNLPPHQIKKDLEVVHRNAIRLGKLVDQLLDYRKIEAGKLKLELSKGDIVSFLKSVLLMFEELSREKQVKLEFFSVLDQMQLFFDPDKIEKVLFNLLSNAFKHTPEGGTISVAVSLTYQMSAEDPEKDSFASGEYVEIVVKDTGTGIPENKREKIFERFYQGKTSEKADAAGSGIGLSLSKELIRIQNGRISLRSREGVGTELTILIPAIKKDPEMKVPPQSQPLVESSAELHEDNLDKQLNEKLLDCNTPVILVVEDNQELREFIVSIFDEEYNVITAEDGESGLELAFTSIPDIIISDILMPKMDGKKFCKNVKQDFRTSHIPLIFLTALSSKQHEKEGILLGADEYISKPFDASLLKVRVDQLLATRRLLREKYTRNTILEPNKLTVISKDDKFLRKLVEIIEANIADPEFGTVRISREVGVSRTQLYRKMAALTEMTVKEFIRSIRLKRASQLVLEEELNISEVAYSVGFQQVAYFRKCFKEMFGMTPTEYIKRNSINIKERK